LLPTTCSEERRVVTTRKGKKRKKCLIKICKDCVKISCAGYSRNLSELISGVKQERKKERKSERLLQYFTTKNFVVGEVSTAHIPGPRGGGGGQKKKKKKKKKKK